LTGFGDGDCEDMTGFMGDYACDYVVVVAESFVGTKAYSFCSQDTSCLFTAARCQINVPV